MSRRLSKSAWGTGTGVMVMRGGLSGLRARPLSSMAAISAQIEHFPEYKLANDQELVGKFDHALPNYLRAKEVMVRTTGGPHSDYSSMVAMRIGKLYCSMGRYKDAVESLGDIEKYPDNHFKVHAHQLASTSLLLEGNDIHAALEAACAATTVCENLHCHSDHSSDHYHLFSKNYTLQGLSCLLLGQLTSAEEHLQLAARWADNPTDKIISLSNIGSLFCAMANYSPPVYDGTNSSFPSKEEAVASRDLVRQTSLIRDGLEYWLEAMKARKILTPVHSMGTPSVDTPILTEDHSEANLPTSEAAIEEKLSEDLTASFTTAYVTILCNIAEAEIKLGDKSGAAQHLSSALEALKINAQHYPNNDFIHSPYLGRCLYLSGCTHFHSGDFVLAEGLFKAAIAKFESNAFCRHDTRHAYEMMRAMHSYGMLLQKWDKRESEGGKWISKAGALETNMPKYPVYSTSSSSQQPGDRGHLSHLLLMLPTF